MNFDLTDEQQMLQDTVTRWTTDAYGFSIREHALKSADGWSRTAYAELAEMGLLGLPFAEEDGGFGGGGIDMMVVMEALGRGLCVEPYFGCVVLAGAVLRRAATAEQRATIIPGIVAGERILALAHNEPGMPRHTTEARLTATPVDGGWKLNGRKIAVIHGQSADTLIVSATTDKGSTLFVVDTTSTGVTVIAQRGYDGVPVATVDLADVAVTSDVLLGTEGGAEPILAAAFEEANAALVAEGVGAMGEALDLTTEYLKTRQQFGVAIGSFQALQHRAVELLMQVELSRSMAILAALALDAEPGQRWRDVAAAKAQIGKSARIVGQEAVQMHGAIGVTTEYKVGHLFKRLTAIDALLGGREYHLAALADAGGLYQIAS